MRRLLFACVLVASLGACAWLASETEGEALPPQPITTAVEVPATAQPGTATFPTPDGGSATLTVTAGADGKPVGSVTYTPSPDAPPSRPTVVGGLLGGIGGLASILLGKGGPLTLAPLAQIVALIVGGLKKKTA